MVFNSLVIFLVAVTVYPSNPLRITNFYVPRRAYNQVDIDCKYDLEGRQLYSVKWYKDGQEFLRCTAQGEVLQFPLPGVMTRHPPYSNEGSCPVTLIALSPDSTGDYLCEVSLDAPDFVTTYRHSRMDIIMPTSTAGDHSERTAKGIEKHTSDEEIHVISSGVQISKHWLLLLFSVYLVFT